MVYQDGEADMSVILSEVKGFTPVIDVIVKDVGLVEAVVYGVVWRYCQRANGVCTASLETIGAQVGVSDRTVLRHVKALCDKGYLIDTTPELRNRPHVYKDAGKVKIQGLLEAGETGVTESHTDAVGVTESHTRGDRKSPLGVTESQLKIHETVEETICNQEDGRAWFVALSDLCVVDLAVSTKTQRDQLGQTAKILRTKAEASPEQITAFGEWWYENDWRGKQGQPPTPAQVRSEWGKFKASGVADGRRVIRIGR